MSQSNFYYLDYAASAPERPEAAAARQAYEQSAYAGANPNSLHTLGRMAASALEGARSDMARCIGGGFRPSDIIFTSGGTESNNMAVFGLAQGARAKDRNRTVVALSAIEHDSILDLAAPLRSQGFEVVFLKPSAQGIIEPRELARIANKSLALVSCMSANNETGAVQPIDELALAAHEAGALFHTDAVQAFGRIPLQASQVDALSVAGHKIGAPVGVGVLALRARTPFRPQSFGGGQEAGRRAGTQDVLAALQLAAVSKSVCGTIAQTRALVAQRANHMYKRLSSSPRIVPTISATVDDTRLPGIVHIMVDGCDSETLVLRLDAAGFEVSAASACSSGSLDPSHVLSAMGIKRDLALGSLRISFDERVSEDVLDAFCDALLDIVTDI